MMQMWRGIVNMPADEFWATPVGEFWDVVSCYQVGHGAALESQIVDDLL